MVKKLSEKDIKLEDVEEYEEKRARRFQTRVRAEMKWMLTLEEAKSLLRVAEEFLEDEEGWLSV
jgi:hypothetical protein